MFTFLFEKFSRIYFNENRLREESMFWKIDIAGSRRSTNCSVVLVEEFDLDLTLIFFGVWFFEFVFLTTRATSPNSGIGEVNMEEDGTDRHLDSGAGLLKVACGCGSDIRIITITVLGDLCINFIRYLAINRSFLNG